MYKLSNFKNGKIFRELNLPVNGVFEYFCEPLAIAPFPSTDRGGNWFDL